MSRADYRSRPNSRPQSASDQLIDLHVYVVPEDIWRERYNNLLNQSVGEAISIGIIRVHPELRLREVREELVKQLEDVVPSEYVFLRSVGRSLTQLKRKQEKTLKAKYFVPPDAYAPELFLLIVSPNSHLESESDSRSQSSFRQLGDSPRSNNRGYNSYRDDFNDPGSKTYRRDYRDRDPDRDRERDRDRYRDQDGYNDKYSQSKNNNSRASRMAPPPRNGKPGAADLQTENSSRMQRGSDRASPPQRYSPLPHLDPASPSGSRNASPQTERIDRQYRAQSRSPDRNNDNERRYDNDRQTDDRDNKYNRRYDDKNIDDRNQRNEDNRSRRDDRYDRNRGRGSRYDNRNEDRYVEPESGKDSRNFHVRYEKPRESPDREGNNAYVRDMGGETYRRVSPDPDSSMNGFTVLPPIHDSPHPRSAERGPSKRGEHKDRTSDPRSATYTTNTNTDSGIADSGVSPEDRYRRRGRNDYEDEMARKRYQLGNRLANDKFDIYDDDAYTLDDMEERDQIDRERWERDRDYRRQFIEEERRRREEEMRKKRQEDDDNNEDRKKMKRSESEEELARYPSPPELEMGSPRETESARRRNREERERLLQELEAAREGRKNTEREREELVKKAKQLQNKTTNRRNHARDIWKKRYFEEKKKTAPLEEQTNRYRHELDNLHRKLMSTLEGTKEKNIKLSDSKPSLKNNYVIQCTRLQHEIEDLRRRVENAKMKLTAEMKLRNQAEAELRALRAELTQKKINLTLTRNQQLAALNPSGDLPPDQPPAIAPQSYGE